MARLIYYNEEITPEGDMVIKKAWKINKNRDFPHGIKYSLAYIHNGKRILGYDNERSKGDHKHYFEDEEKYNFVDVNKLSDDFDKDIKNLRRKLYGNQEG